MNLNKKGLSLVEIIISVALLGVIMLFLYSLLSGINKEATDPAFSITNQLERFEIINSVQKDLIQEKISEIKVNNIALDQKELEIVYDQDKRTVLNIQKIEDTEKYSNKIELINKENESTIWNYDDVILDLDNILICSNVVSHTELQGLQIRIPVYTDSEDNNKDKNTILDDIIISYVGVSSDTTDYPSCAEISTEYVPDVDLPLIESVTISDVTGKTFKVEVNAVEGTNAIVMYYYSIDAGVNFQASKMNSYTFADLTPDTTYTINVFVKDAANYESVVAETEITLPEYSPPPILHSITESDLTANSIKVTLGVESTGNPIEKYYYSKDNGATYISTGSNVYTFTGLDEDKLYNIKAYIEDNEEQESEVLSKSVRTDKKPVANSISTSGVTGSAFKMTLNATKGTNNLATYYFSNNNGSSYVTSTTNSYTFTGLSSKTYNLKAYVVDNKTQSSNIVSGSVLVPKTCPYDGTYVSTKGNNWTSTGSYYTDGDCDWYYVSAGCEDVWVDPYCYYSYSTGTCYDWIPESCSQRWVSSYCCAYDDWGDCSSTCGGYYTTSCTPGYYESYSCTTSTYVCDDGYWTTGACWSAYWDYTYCWDGWTTYYCTDSSGYTKYF